MASYNEYKKSNENPFSLADWRRENVNVLISSCYNAIKYANKDIIFSVSPAASVKNNYENLYADVDCWIKSGYVDEIIPQLYFGFEYPDTDFKFENLINRWIELTKANPNVRLKIGLGSYKAKPTLEADKAEWNANSDIISRQVRLCCEENAVSGYVYFSYSSLFGEDTAYKNQRENILKYINGGVENE
jgi:uncharacterized lipoprotein YddW (UPF0748 family)